MSEGQSDIVVNVLGKKYRIKCPADKVLDLQESAVLLDSKMCEVRDHGKMVGVDRIAVVAALNIAHELLAYKKQKSTYIRQMTQQMATRIQELELKIKGFLEKG